MLISRFNFKSFSLVWTNNLYKKESNVTTYFFILKPLVYKSNYHKSCLSILISKYNLKYNPFNTFQANEVLSGHGLIIIPKNNFQSQF